MDPCVSGIFCKTVVQAVLLFGSETWVLTPSTMQVLEGFRIQSAYRMARVNKPRKHPQTGVWIYPSSALVLDEVGLSTISHYVQVSRYTITAFHYRATYLRFLPGWWYQPLPLVVGTTSRLGFGEGGRSGACCS